MGADEKKIMKKGGKVKSKGKKGKVSKAKGKTAGKKVGKKKGGKKDIKRMNLIAKAVAYGVMYDMIDLETACVSMSKTTKEEVKQIFRSLKSAEKLKATAEGREAEVWAGAADSIKDKDAVMMFNHLDSKKQGHCDFKTFVDTCVKCVKIKVGEKGKTPRQIEEEKRAEQYAELDWTSEAAVVSTWPVYVQEQIKNMRKKKVPKTVHIEDFSMKIPFGTDYLLDFCELKIGIRQKLALIGEPGSGKSTLFDLMSSNQIKEFPNHLSVWHMKEIEVSPDAESLLETVVHSDAFLMALRRNKVQLVNRIEGKEGHPEPSAEAKAALKANLHLVETKLREKQSDFAEEEAAKSLRVLGFDDTAQAKSINSLSGGLRMRVALCAAFFVQADILLLDEPTNHLDFPSLLWLENKLRTYRNSYVMVCHDREILNNVCTGVMRITDELDIKYYEMGFEAYEKKREKDDKDYAKAVEKFLLKHRKIDFSSPLAVQAAKKRKWLDDYCRKMVLRAGQFTFPAPTELEPDNEQKGMDLAQKDINVIKVSNVRFSYDAETLPFIFDTPISIDITMSSRMGVMGPNGAGKSTFLKLLTGRLHPVEGTITTNKNASIGYFSQHHSAEMDLTMTPLDWMMDIFPEEKVGNLRAHLGKVGCSGDLTQVRMTDHSQGMRSCILFAKITYKCPNLLIMDEPTNFLDIETVDALIHATNKYKGALLLVSHSRLFLEMCATAYLSIVPGQFDVFQDLKECERATYTFIAQMEEGDKVKIGAGNLAQHGANAEYGGNSEQKNDQNNDGLLVI